MARPYRSALYIPASNARAMDKARSLAADALIFDLEDAVAVDEKVAARDALCKALAGRDHGPPARLVRINGLATGWGEPDLAAFATRPDVDGLVLPKVADTAMLDSVAARVPDIPLWAMIETPLGVLNVAAIAAHPRVAGLIVGTNDLTRDLGAATRADRLPMLASLGLCLLAARAHGRIVLDGVYNTLRDEPGLAAECRQGRDLGFDGKTLIHPAQIDTANAIFSPTANELALAARQIEAWDAATRAGQGVAVLDGRIVENMHVAAARDMLDRAAAIAARAV